MMYEFYLTHKFERKSFRVPFYVSGAVYGYCPEHKNGTMGDFTQI